MKRLFSSLIILSLLLFCGAAEAQTSICPKNEILQFGNLFGYSTMVCKKDQEGNCSTEKSDVIYFYINRVNDMGCGFGKDCGSCLTNQVKTLPLAKTASYYAYQHNFNINRQNNVNSGVFLDATKGTSRTDGFEFAMSGKDKSAAYYAIFHISVKYQLPKSDKIEYLTGPVALQLAAKPPVSDFHTAKVDKAALVVTKDDKESTYALVLRDTGNQVFLKSTLMKRVEKDPLPEPPAPTKGTNSKQGSGSRVPTIQGSASRIQGSSRR